MANPPNPYDPNHQMYPGQAPIRPPAPNAQPAPAAPASVSSLHFLQGALNLASAFGSMVFTGSEDEEEEEERPVSRYARAAAPKRVGKGSCCRRPTR